MDKTQNHHLHSAFCIISLVILSACAQTPLATPTSTLAPTAKPTSTPIPTLTSTPIPTTTNTPEPTQIPGIQVYPVSSLGKGIPWLPYDDAKKPMAVYYGFNMNKPPFNNDLVRKAFAAAVDREQITQKAMDYNFRNAVPATSLTPPEILSVDLYNEVGIPFNPSKAKEYLEEAGYTSVDSFPTTTLLVSTRGKGAPGAYYQMAKIIVGMWETNLGIKVEIEVVNIGTYQNHFITNPPDLYQLGWVADYKDPDNFLNALFHTNNDVNFGHFSNQEYDRLVEDAARLTDPEKRLLLYIQAEQILTEQEVGLIPLYHCYVPIPYAY